MKKIAIVAALCVAPLTASAGEMNAGATASWSGFYFGGNAGVADNNEKTNYSYS